MQKYRFPKEFPNKAVTLYLSHHELIIFMTFICNKYLLLCFTLAFALMACTDKKTEQLTPWGTSLSEDTISYKADAFSLSEIQNNGELIMLTISGPNTYYDYRGKHLGLHYLLCEQFAQKLGVSLRVEVCKDTVEMIQRLSNGEADIIAYPLTHHHKQLILCGVHTENPMGKWAVNQDNQELADKLNQWFQPQLIAKIRKEENFLLSTRSIVRHVYSPMLNRANGTISHYDKYFLQYAPLARWDWRLMAAQCYQESTFDPRARSWAGACGLMQIMPGTARHLGLPLENIFDPESNIAASAKYLAELSRHFKDVRNPIEQYHYVLASYNGGSFHIRDAMALARKYGKNPYRWTDVSEFVLKLRQPEYYNDPVVKYGYMRGNETVEYVQRIIARWQQYRGVAKPGTYNFGNMTPQKASRRNRFKL